MQSVLQRLQEMPYHMLVRVANKYKLLVELDETKESIIDRLEEIISDCLLDKQSEDVCVDGTLTKFNLLRDFEVPHFFDKKNVLWAHNSIFNNVTTYIDVILIDNQWCYLYWDLSQHDLKKIRYNKDFEGFEVHVLYKKESFNKDYTQYDDKDIITISLSDTDLNFYHLQYFTFCCCLFVARYRNNRHQLLSASEELFLPHILPVWDRHDMSMREKKILELSFEDEKEELSISIDSDFEEGVTL